MSIVFDVAELLNIAWGVAADRGEASLRDRLADATFRRRVVARASQSLDQQNLHLEDDKKKQIRLLIKDANFVQSLIVGDETAEAALDAVLNGASHSQMENLRLVLGRAFLEAILAAAAPTDLLMLTRLGTITTRTEEIVRLVAEVRSLQEARIPDAEDRGPATLANFLDLLVLSESRLKSVSETTILDFGVRDPNSDLTPSTIPPYVRRTIDVELRARFRPLAGSVPRPVFVTADASAGVTRSIYEALRTTRGDDLLLHLAAPAPTLQPPDTLQPLEKIAELANRGTDELSVDGSGIVLWVDQWDAHITRGLTLQTLMRLEEAWPKALVVGSISSSGLESLQQWEPNLLARIMRAFGTMRLEQTLRAKEVDEARRLYGQVLTYAELRILPATLDASTVVRRRYVSATPVVRAVIDATFFLTDICNFGIEQRLIEDVATALLQERGSGTTKGSLDLAINSLKPRRSKSPDALIHHDPECGLIASPLLSRWVERSQIDTSRAAWGRLAKEIADTPALHHHSLDIAGKAALRDVKVVAAELYELASRDASNRDIALYNLAGILFALGRKTEAVAAWTHSSGSTDKRIRLAALTHLSVHGALGEDLDLSEESEDAMVLWTIVQVNRAIKGTADGQLDEARERLIRISEQGMGNTVQFVNLELGKHFASVADNETALRYLAQAAQGGDSKWAAEASLASAEIIFETSPVQAIELCSTLAQGADRIYRESSRLMGARLALFGQVEGKYWIPDARLLIHSLVDLASQAEESSTRDEARRLIPLAYQMAGDHIAAMEEYQLQAEETSGEAQVACYLEAGNIARYELDDKSLARHYFRLAYSAATPTSLFFARAAQELANSLLHHAPRDPVEAEALYVAAIQNGAPDDESRGIALLNLGSNWEQLHPGDTQGGIPILEAAVAHPLPRVSVSAAIVLSRIVERAHALRLLRDAWDVATASGSEELLEELRMRSAELE